MLTYRLVKDSSTKKIYEYYPEGNTDCPGRVVFFNDGRKEVISDSDEDFQGYYRGHALYGIDIESKSGTVAWC